MPVMKLTPQFIATSLFCPPGKTRIEFCDSTSPASTSPSAPPVPAKACITCAGRTATTRPAIPSLAGPSTSTWPKPEGGEDSYVTTSPSAPTRKPKLVPRRPCPPSPSSSKTISSLCQAAEAQLAARRRDVSAADQGAVRPLRLNEVSRKQVQIFHNRLLTDGLKPASADHVLKLMRRAFNLAVEWEILETSPLTRLQLFNPDNRMENYLSPEQLDKLVTVLRTAPPRTVCNVALFLLATGARLNEALRATLGPDRPGQLGSGASRPATASPSVSARCP